jgi:hypothetical protein
MTRGHSVVPHQRATIYGQDVPADIDIDPPSPLRLGSNERRGCPPQPRRSFMSNHPGARRRLRRARGGRAAKARTGAAAPNRHALERKWPPLPRLQTLTSAPEALRVRRSPPRATGDPRPWGGGRLRSRIRRTGRNAAGRSPGAVAAFAGGPRAMRHTDTHGRFGSGCPCYRAVVAPSLTAVGFFHARHHVKAGSFGATGKDMAA